MSSHKGKAKSVGSYLLGGIKISLPLLGTLSGVIPVPWIKSAIDAATKVIEIAQVAQSNRADRKKLIDHVYALMLVIVMPLQKKTEAEIPAELKANIERLSSDLTDIAQELRKLNKETDPHRIGSFMRSIVLASKITGQIQDCTNRLNWAMDLFHVATRIDDTLRNSRIESGVQEIQTGIQRIELKLENSPGNLQKVLSPLSTIIPPKPAIFCGRDEEVEDIAQRILANSSARYVIRGPGGIGKTSAAVAVSEHKDVVQRFGSRRFWVRCEEASSPSLLVDLVARALQVTTGSDDPLRDITFALSTDDRPRLLLLDNFETPLDIEGHQSDILDILRTLCDIPHLSLLLTLRGVLPGPNLIGWSKPELTPLSTLSLESARQMYIAIHPQAIEDKQLDPLLVELGGMPLAVELVAGRGLLGDSPSTLLRLWKEAGPDLVDEPGADRRTSVNKSIELSLQTNIVKGNPDATRLLSVMAFLPGGVHSSLIEPLIPSISSSSHSKARAALLRTSLIYANPDSSTYFVLSPIRSFVIRHNKLTPELWKGVFHCYVKFLEQHCPHIGKSDFPENVKAIGKEEANVEAVLLLALQSGNTPVPAAAAIEASLIFTLYQIRIRPRSDVAIVAAKAAGDQPLSRLLPATLHQLGELEYRQGKYAEARDALQRAHREFKRLRDARGAAQCIQRLGDIDYAQGNYGEARDALQQAQREFERVSDPLCAAQCLRSLGIIHYLQRMDTEARDALQEAQREFERLGDPLGVAQCLLSLGDIDRIQRKYNEARGTLQKAQREFEKLGEPFGAAQCLQRLGDIDYLQSNYDEARDALQKANQEFVRLGNPFGMVQCLQRFGDIDYMEGKYDEARNTLQMAKQDFKRLGNPVGVAECLRGLGNIGRMQGRYDEALGALTKAHQEFERLGHPVGAAQCLLGIGRIEHIQGKYNDAKDTLQKAQREFERLGDSVGTAQCLKSLVDIERMQPEPRDEQAEVLQCCV